MFAPRLLDRPMTAVYSQTISFQLPALAVPVDAAEAAQQVGQLGPHHVREGGAEGGHTRTRSLLDQLSDQLLPQRQR
jgi:hypothetical protein